MPVPAAIIPFVLMIAIDSFHYLDVCPDHAAQSPALFSSSIPPLEGPLYAELIDTIASKFKVFFFDTNRDQLERKYYSVDDTTGNLNITENPDDATTFYMLPTRANFMPSESSGGHFKLGYQSPDTSKDVVSLTAVQVDNKFNVRVNRDDPIGSGNDTDELKTLETIGLVSIYYYKLPVYHFYGKNH